MVAFAPSAAATLLAQVAGVSPTATVTLIVSGLPTSPASVMTTLALPAVVIVPCGDGAHRARRRGHATDRVIIGVGDDLGCGRRVEGQAGGVIEARGRAETVGITCLPRHADERGNIASRGNPADGVVHGIGDENVVRRQVHNYALRGIEASRAAIAVGGAAEPGGTSERGDHAGRGDLADRTIAGVRDVKVA